MAQFTACAGGIIYGLSAGQHAIHPANRFELKEATACGKAEFLPCGDHFRLFLHVKESQILKATFEAEACPAVIAVGSVGTQMIVGLSVDEAAKVSAFQLDEALGGLPAAKRHAYLLFIEALAQASQMCQE